MSSARRRRHSAGSDFAAAAALSLILLAFCSSIMAVGEIVASRHEARDAPV